MVDYTTGVSLPRQTETMLTLSAEEGTQLARLIVAGLMLA